MAGMSTGYTTFETYIAAHAGDDDTTYDHDPHSQSFRHRTLWSAIFSDEVGSFLPESLALVTVKE